MSSLFWSGTVPNVSYDVEIFKHEEWTVRGRLIHGSEWRRARMLGFQLRYA